MSKIESIKNYDVFYLFYLTLQNYKEIMLIFFIYFKQ